MEKKEVLNIPMKVDQLRIKHLKVVDLIREWDGVMSNEFICRVVAVAASKRLTWVTNKADLRDISKAFNYVVKSINSLNEMTATHLDKKPPKEVTIKGTVYELVNLDRPNMSFIIDVDRSDFIKDPVRLAAMCYIPKGTTYGEMDDGENLLNPISDRYEDFAEEFRLVDFILLNGFFLRRFRQLGNAYILRQKVKNNLRKVQRMIGL
jgi:hypothetical protein